MVDSLEILEEDVLEHLTQAGETVEIESIGDDIAHLWSLASCLLVLAIDTEAHPVDHMLGKTRTGFLALPSCHSRC